MPDSTLLSSQRVYEGRIFDVTVDRVRLPHGREATLEVVRHEGSVVLVPMTRPMDGCCSFGSIATRSDASCGSCRRAASSQARIPKRRRRGSARRSSD